MGGHVSSGRTCGHIKEITCCLNFNTLAEYPFLILVVELMYIVLINITSALRLGFSVASAELINSCSTIEARPISVCQALRQVTAAART